MAQNKIKLRTQKRDGEPFQYDRINQICFDKFQEQAKAGNYEVIFARKLPDKSQNQLGAIFGLVIKQTLEIFSDRGYDTSYLLKTDKPTGIEVSPALLKEYLYAVCPIFRDGLRITLSKADVAEANKFFDNIRNFIASQWSIPIDDPNKNWKTKGK